MQQITATRIKIPFATILAAALALPVEADVEMSFAGRLKIDSPAPLELAAKGALAPWRTMTTSGMTERILAKSGKFYLIWLN